jgi:hypothetical protein
MLPAIWPIKGTLLIRDALTRTCPGGSTLSDAYINECRISSLYMASGAACEAQGSRNIGSGGFHSNFY